MAGLLCRNGPLVLCVGYADVVRVLPFGWGDHRSGFGRERLVHRHAARFMKTCRRWRAGESLRQGLLEAALKVVHLLVASGSLVLISRFLCI